MDPFPRLDAALEQGGPTAALESLVADRRAAGDFQAVFYARLMQARLRFGAPPFPDGPASDIPAEHHEAYEAAIRAAGREAGQAHLDRGEFPQAWQFFRMLGETEPVRAALVTYEPAEDADVSPAVEVAWHHAVHPAKGFDLVLDRHGLCSAITLVQSSDLSTKPEVRTHCVGRLVRALYAQLSERLANDPADGDLPADSYHVDPSHLMSVAQLALHLPAGPDAELARELCGYGARLHPDLRGRDDPPFDQTFTDYREYLAGNLDHFRRKCAAGAADGYRYPAEVLVTLLDRAGLAVEALAVARQHLADADERSLGCPGPTALARRVGDYSAAAAVARQRGDAIAYLAAVIAGSGR